MADIDVDTGSWRRHVTEAEGIGQAVEQGGSAYMAALDGNVFGIFTPVILPVYMTVSQIFAQRNTESGQRVKAGAKLLSSAADDFERNEQTWKARFDAFGQQMGAY